MQSALDGRDPHTGLILLAAGASTRLGQPKQLLPFRGRSLLRHAAEVALASGIAPIVVVIGAGAARLRQELDGLPITVTVNWAWSEGMASSLRCGIAALDVAKVEAVMVLLCDQPLVTPEALRRLIAAHATEQRPVAASEYGNGAIGPPCLFARSLFPDLLALKGAQGAKQVLSRLPDSDITRVPLPEGAVDIDTMDDWATLNAESGSVFPPQVG